MVETNFQQTLVLRGLGQYYERFIAEAFDSWDILSQITESDLDALDVKRGHRRTLQLAIADYQRSRAARASSEQSVESSSTATPTEAAPRVKRKYVRHPKPDACAPEKPLTGYVLFANQTRDGLKDKNLGFPEIAKIVGARWRDLEKEKKDVYLNRARELKDIANRKLDEYKKTTEFREYQRYLIDFKATQLGITRTKRAYPDDEEQQQHQYQHDHDHQHSQQQQAPPRHVRRSLSLDQRSAGSDVPAASLGYFAPVQSPTLLEPTLIMGPAPYVSSSSSSSGAARYPPTSPEGASFYQLPTHSIGGRQLPPLMKVTSFRQ